MTEPAVIDSFLAKAEGMRVLVVGDLMIDAYVWGQARRISPEAPVQVVDMEAEELRPGGAGNVIRNLVDIGCRVVAGGVLGDDRDGSRMVSLLEERGVATAGLVLDPARCTSRKTRVLAGHQQIVRIDREDRHPLSRASEARLAGMLERIHEPCRAILVSDYRKGGVTPAILAVVFELGRRWNVPVVVDPKGSDFSCYRGASVLTPNRRELRLATCLEGGGEADFNTAAARLRTDLDLEALVVTRSEEGMSLFLRDGSHLQLPADAREVFDVTGAGDTVLALLGAGMGTGLPVARAAKIANLAAGVVVGKIGAATLSPGELRLAATSGGAENERKICSREGLAALLNAERERGRKVVFTNGCFDLLHVGHVRLLQKARAFGDILVLGLNSDDSIRRLKGPDRPLIDERERAHLLAALGCVDYLVVFDEDTPLELIRALRPDVLVKGGDYTPESVVGRELVESRGGRVELVRLVEGRSSSGIIRKILETCGER